MRGNPEFVEEQSSDLHQSPKNRLSFRQLPANGILRPYISLAGLRVCHPLVWRMGWQGMQSGILFTHRSVFVPAGRISISLAVSSPLPVPLTHDRLRPVT